MYHDIITSYRALEKNTRAVIQEDLDLSSKTRYQEMLLQRNKQGTFYHQW